MADYSGCFFSVMSFDWIATAMVEGDAITFAKDEDSVSLPVEVAIEVATETLRLALEEDGIRNEQGQGMATYLGQADEANLRRLLARISDPDGPTFTRPTPAPRNEGGS